MLFKDLLPQLGKDTSRINPNDESQYISVYIGVERATKQVGLLTLHFPAAADKKQGFFLAFATTQQVAGKWTADINKDQTLHLGFDSCDSRSCVARMRDAKADDGKGGLIDLRPLLDKEGVLLLLYTEKGRPIRAAVGLIQYRAAFEEALRNLKDGPRHP